MKGLVLGVLVVVSCLKGHADIPTKLDWQLKREQLNLKIYTASIENSKLKAVRIETSFKSSVEPLIRLLFDPELRQSWDEMCKQVKVLGRTERENISYLRFDMPWPVKDRDVVMKSQLNITGKVATITSEAGDKSVPRYSQYKRVTEAWYRWQLIDGSEQIRSGTLADSIAQTEAKTALIAEMYMDPAGPIPAWLLNHLALTQPGITIEKLRELVE